MRVRDYRLDRAHHGDAAYKQRVTSTPAAAAKLAPKDETNHKASPANAIAAIKRAGRQLI